MVMRMTRTGSFSIIPTRYGNFLLMDLPKKCVKNWDNLFKVNGKEYQVLWRTNDYNQ